MTWANQAGWRQAALPSARSELRSRRRHRAHVMLAFPCTISHAVLHTAIQHCSEMAGLTRERASQSVVNPLPERSSLALLRFSLLLLMLAAGQRSDARHLKSLGAHALKTPRHTDQCPRLMCCVRVPCTRGTEHTALFLQYTSRCTRAAGTRMCNRPPL